MAIKKVKNELKDKIALSITEVISGFNSNIGDKLKRSALNSAKKIAEKFAKSLKAFEKAEKKAQKKQSKKLKKSTKAKIKAIERSKTNVSAEKTAPARRPRIATPVENINTPKTSRRTTHKATSAVVNPMSTAPKRRKPAAPKATTPPQTGSGNTQE